MTQKLTIYGERFIMLGGTVPMEETSPEAQGNAPLGLEDFGTNGQTDEIGEDAYISSTGDSAQAPLPPQEPVSPLPMLLIWGGVFVAMWFILIRPQRKREKKMREMQAAITTGDNVVTSGGLFGKVADVGDDCFVVEFGTNRGVRIPVLKSDVVGIRTPSMTPQPKDSTE